jgi:hypothetical protein
MKKLPARQGRDDRVQGLLAGLTFADSIVVYITHD